MPEFALPNYAEPFAQVVIDNLTTEFPYAAHHVQRDSADLLQPRQMHPAFANSFDWHSSVHMHWLGTQLIEHVEAETSGRIVDVLQQHLSADNMRAEAEYVAANPSWERPYGWAWAAQLVDALHDSRVPEVNALAEGARPLLDAVMDAVRAWLPAMPEPVRHGVHSNTAFGLRRLLLVGRRRGYADVADLIVEHARRFYGADTRWPFSFERSGHDFLSAGMCEADLMCEVLAAEAGAAPSAESAAELTDWLPGFMAELAEDARSLDAGSLEAGKGKLPRVLQAVAPIDASDGHQSHLDGLGLTLAASGLRVARTLDALDAEPELADTLRTAAPRLMRNGLAAATTDEFMASHWLATFGWEALTELSR
ncbi:hypothetical protein HMPREF3160_05430 [Arthrobacter sp. HMSC06H05]|uniref:DUF2891 family protein n=1 Tax=Arthrobacter sp. HMSC06H05 TaxID=1581128 RepID=UPI0008A55377|nr:DUF2891 family protein [Arthrobacter sp. HMSC06H05]OFT42188.1 hypothetical protein HMPREF3160_05430 [Arthrobacter sp. HMSC06H05]